MIKCPDCKVGVFENGQCTECKLSWEDIEAASTYKIVRFHQSLEVENEVIETGLTLEEAQAHCSKDDSRGPDWFDGWTEE